MGTDRRPRWDIADVLDRTDLAALLDEHTAGTGNGHRRRWHCPVPDHHDQHASVTTHTDARGHQRWRCWSGDDTHRGDAIDLMMITRHLDRGAAIDLLAARAGLRIDEPLPPPRRHPSPPQAAAGPVPLDSAVARYVIACEQVLWSRTGRPVRDWLASRGFTDELLRANHIGADPGRTMLRRPRGLPSGRSLAATFPALDPDGDITYVQTRYLHPEPGGPKYENPAATLGSNPRLAWTVPVGDPQPECLIVCEGIPDALTAAQHGTRSVAVLGAQAPDRRVAQHLHQHAAAAGLHLVAVVDADPAGRAWGYRLTSHLDDLGTPLRIVEPPTDGLDLNDWARRDPTWTHTALTSPRVVTDRAPTPTATQPEVSLP